MTPPIYCGDLYWVDSKLIGGPAFGPAHPYLVVQADVFNHSRIETVVVCAITSNIHRATEPGNVLLDEGEGGLFRRSVIVVSQILSMRKVDLGTPIGSLSVDRVEQALEGLRFQQRSFFDER